MRVIVISDSHGDSYSVRSVMEQQPSADTVFFLGDGEHDVDFLCSAEGITLYRVKGNCDFGSGLPAFINVTVGGKKFYCTHGYAERVKYTKEILLGRAASYGAHIALYGHTHVSDTVYSDGIWLVNPGSLRSGEYAVIDITPSGIMPISMKLR